jgi:hypothetical protein
VLVLGIHLHCLIVCAPVFKRLIVVGGGTWYPSPIDGLEMLSQAVETLMVLPEFSSPPKNPKKNASDSTPWCHKSIEEVVDLACSPVKICPPLEGKGKCVY